MNKKGVITIFIILGIVMLIIFFFVFFASDQLSDAFSTNVVETWETFEDVSKFEETMEDCLEENAQIALITLGLQGGYINLNNYIEIEGNRISYDEFTLDTMENEISTYLLNNLERNCNYGQDVSELESVDTEIQRTRVEISTNWDLEIIDQEAQPPTAQIDSDLYDIYGFVEQVRANPIVTPLNTNFTVEVTTDYDKYVYFVTADEYLFMFGI
ncbi:hypothetical protein HOE07_00390 [archaeon]|nr:hypothetical protein [archaeon]